MARQKKLGDPVTLFAAIEAEQHEALRTIAFQQRRSIADVVRQAIDEFVAKQPQHPRIEKVLSAASEKAGLIRP